MLISVLHLIPDEDNPRAIGWYERLGFVREGVRPAAVRRGSTYVDLIFMGRVRKGIR